MKITPTIDHTLRALAGATCAGTALFLHHTLAAALLVLSGILLCLAANLNSVPLVNKAINFRRLPRATPLPTNELSQIHYDVRHAPRPGRLL